MPDRPTTSNQRPGPRELLRQMGTATLYREAYDRGLSLSAYLEEVDPSDQYNDGLDGFSRLMKEAGIITHSDPVRGIWASPWSDFEKDANTRALVPEFMTRCYRRAATGIDQRALFTSQDYAVNTAMKPYTDAAGLRVPQLQPAIPLSELIAITTPIDGDAYRSLYLVEPSANDKRLVRVAEGAEIPRTKLATKEQAIRLHKFARAMELTYEQLRRARIDLVALLLARMAIQAEVDKVVVALDVYVNGDGNSNTAATVYNLTTLDAAASAGTLTLKGWLAFKAKFLNPYVVTTALVQEAGYLQLMLLNTGSANIPLMVIQGGLGLGSVTPINNQLGDSVRVGLTADAPTLKVVAFDKRFALERVFEVGADISEVERFIMRQTQAITLSEVEGYGIFDQQATKILNINA